MRFDPHAHLIVSSRGSRNTKHPLADSSRLLLSVTGLAAARAAEDQGQGVR
jgi:hypothetical protein